MSKTVKKSSSKKIEEKSKGSSKKTSTSKGTANIKVVGIGGAGGSTLQRMVDSKIFGVEYIAINTDNQALRELSRKIKKIRIGNITKGQGTGSNPDLGREAVEKNTAEIKKSLKNADIIFLAAGFGGGTGTGGTLAIADILNNSKAVVVAVVTKPFSFEGPQKKSIANQGFKKIGHRVDSFIPIYNDKLLQVIDKSTPLLDAFSIADEVLKQGIQGISDIINIPGLINIDFADIKPILQKSGKTMIGMGQAEGKDRAKQAIQDALKNTLMNLSIKGASGVIFVIKGPSNLKMMEINEISEIVTEQVGIKAKVVFGVVIDKKLKDTIKVTLIATGFDKANYHGFDSQDLEDEEDDYFSEQDFKPVKKVKKEAEIHVYQNRENEDEDQEEEIIKEKKMKMSEEDELEIPAFLRKKRRKK